MNETNNLAQSKCEPIIIGDVSASPFFSFFNADNMEIMKQYPDKYFDLAIVDPPYGIINKTKRGGQRSPHKYKVRSETWDYMPQKEYWNELFRISINQIVCGGNYFTDFLFPNNAWIFWYKHQPVENYADGEFIWTSFLNKQGKCFDYMYYGSINSAKDRFHPTEKPLELYDWIIKNYAEPNQKILDTHLGSGSIALAIDKANKLDNMNLEFVGIELDTEYFNAAVNRFRLAHTQSCLSF